MAGVYKTPGVYVEEIPKFPPSIAPVETAIPAFIGYTEKAVRSGEDLHNKPVRIESIAEYEAYFGTGPSQDVAVLLDTTNRFVRATANAQLYLYDSLRMFYANGGGNCYVISVGDYPTAVSSAALEAALDVLAQEDEPTLILAPDAVSATAGPYVFQQKALGQCQNLMDRFVVCDLQRAENYTDFKTEVDEFRNGIGINSLKYGAAYGPWIHTALPRNLLRRNILLQRDVTNAPIPLSSLTTDLGLKSLIAELLNIESFVNTAVTEEGGLSGNANLSLEDRLKQLVDGVINLPANATDSNAETTLQGVSGYMMDIILKVQERYNAAPVPTNSRFKVREDIDKYIANSSIKSAFDSVAAHDNHLNTIALLNASGTKLTDTAAFLQTTLPVTTDVSGLYVGAPNAKARALVALTPLTVAANEAIALYRFLQTSQNSYEKILNEALLTSFGTYKELMAKAIDALNLMPPSGAIAGVYAATDRTRGVWKAPANVSLSAVIGPAIKVSDDQQGGYNVDVNAGKSINIIRSFTGKGTLVWGARTLAGNDNEWRYVSVRRFFNFVEESVKKATEQFVFEPNDANTWVRVQAMIENFLTTLWRQGALQGIKPEHAFYVAVGLGKTMTPVDILEGRMIIEIGMAAVRPAEFIILKFSHKMAES